MRDQRIAEVLERTRVVYESAVDLEGALQVFVDALVPDFADLVAIVTIEDRRDDGTVRFHVPAQAWVQEDSATAARRLQDLFAGWRTRREPIMRVLTGREPLLAPDCPDMLDLVEARDDEQRQLLGRVQARSVLAIPLLRGGESIGSMVFGSTAAADGRYRRFGPADLEPARELALRCTAILETHRLRAALGEALTESERHRLRLERLLETMPEGFALISRDLRYLQVNRSLAESQGVEPEDLVGRSVTERVGPMEAQVVVMVRHVLATGETVLGREVTAQGVARPGVRHVLVDLYPVGEGGEVMAVAALLRDITDRVRAERRRAELEEELARARRLETVGRLAGGVAHDFNNILAVVQLRTELLLRRRPDDDELRQSLETVGQAVEQGRELANQLLRFARPEQVLPDVVDLDQLVRDLEPLLRVVAGDDVALELRLSGGPAVLIERAGLQQALLNLVVNARDAMPGGGLVTVETGCRQVDGRGERELRVTDTGTGMDAATRDRAFEPFFSTKPAGVGSGLGLATVYGTVRSAGGTAAIDSEPGRGCSVAVWLPAVDGAPEPAPDPPAAEGGRGERILVVEDQPEVADAVVEMLTSLGYAAMVAATAESAVLVAEGPTELALVITDVVMPGMSGPDLVDELRRQRPELPVLYMSGYTERQPGLGERLEGDELLRKPFNAAELATRVRVVLGNGEAPA